MTSIIYCVGDLHGRHDLLMASRTMIKFDAKKNEYENPIIVYLGDYVDRGPQSSFIVETLMTEPMEGFQEIFLKGNHEEIMYKALEYSTRSTAGKSSIQGWREMWIQNGGISTILNYGILPKMKVNFDSTADLNLLLKTDSWNWNSIVDGIPPAHIQWMKKLPSHVCIGPYIFAHAGVDPTLPPIGQPQANYLWIRNKCYNHEGSYGGYKLIHGHTPTRDSKVFNSKWRMNLDTGAVWKGIQHIAVLPLDGSEERIITTPWYDTSKPIGQR